LDDPTVSVWFEWGEPIKPTACSTWLVAMQLDENDEVCRVKLQLPTLMEPDPMPNVIENLKETMQLTLECMVPFEWWSKERQALALLEDLDGWRLPLEMLNDDVSINHEAKDGPTIAVDVREVH